MWWCILHPMGVGLAAAAEPGSAQDRQRGLRPSRPGEVRNPEGNNQYTYRRKFERAIEELLTGTAPPEVAAKLLLLIPEDARPALQAMGSDVTPGEALAVCTIAQALTGDEKARAEVLKRVWPAVEKHELSGPNGGAIQSQRPDGMENLSDEDRAAARALGRKALQLPMPDVDE